MNDSRQLPAHNIPLIGDAAPNANTVQDGNAILELPDYTELAKKAEDEAKKLESELALRKEENDYPNSYVSEEVVEDEEAEA